MRMGIARCAAIALVIVGVGAFIVMELWNWILPEAAGWHAITYWQALGLLILSKILFGFPFRGGRGWRHRMRERWE